MGVEDPTATQRILRTFNRVTEHHDIRRMGTLRSFSTKEERPSKGRLWKARARHENVDPAVGLMCDAADPALPDSGPCASVLCLSSAEDGDPVVEQMLQSLLNLELPTGRLGEVSPMRRHAASTLSSLKEWHSDEWHSPRPLDDAVESLNETDAIRKRRAYLHRGCPPTPPPPARGSLFGLAGAASAAHRFARNLRVETHIDPAGETVVIRAGSGLSSF